MTARFRLLAVLALYLLAAPLYAQDPSKLSRDSVMRLVATGTGMTKDAVGLALGDSPAALKTAADALTVVKLYTLAAEARDDEAYQAAVDWALGKVADKLLDKTVAGTALGAVSLYKSTLEITRDYVVLPAMDENTYRLYKKTRGTNAFDKGEAGLAFQRATQGAGSTFAVRQRMFEEMLRKRGITKEIVDGTSTGDALYKSIDAYWAQRLEARWQREWIADHKDSLITDAWARQKKAMQIERFGQEVRQVPMSDADKALLADWVAGEQAHAKWNEEYYHKQGYPDAAARIIWNYGPVIADGFLVFSETVEVKIDKDHPFSAISTTGSAQYPFRIPVSGLRSRIWKP